MQLSLRRVLAAACLLPFIACGGPEPSATDEADLTVEHGSPHLLPLSTDEAAKPKAGKLKYYGGPVLENAKVFAVHWGTIDPAVGDHLGDFYSAFVASAHFKWLSEYDTPDQRIGPGSFAGELTITPRAARKKVTDAQIERELAAQIRAGKLPKPDADTIFMVHFPRGVTITSGGSASCQSGGFCGYHSAVRIRGQRLAYAVLPDMGPGSGCDTGCGKGSTLDLVTSVSSHELVEAATDPEVGLAQGLAAPLAWYDPAGGEIGDLCNGKQARVRMGSASWTIQKEWSNSARACIAGK